MRFDKRYRLHLACSDTPVSGLSTDAIRISADGRRALATDAVIAAEVPIRDGQAGEMIDRRAWTEAARGRAGEGSVELRPDGRQEASNALGGRTVILEPSYDERLEAPPIRSLLDQAADEVYPVDDYEIVELRLDASALARLQQAIGAGSVVLRFATREVPAGGRGRLLLPVDGPIQVEDSEPSEARGAILPIVRER